MTAGDLGSWPVSTAQYLRDHYIDVETETGVLPAADFMFGSLADVLWNACVAAAALTPDIESAIGDHGVEVAPLAVQGSPPVSGLFSFDKFSSLPLFLEAIRDDVGASAVNDAARRLFLVPLAHVVKLHATNGTVHAIEIQVAGQRKFLSMAPSAAVVLAAGAIESTRLGRVLQHQVLGVGSFPSLKHVNGCFSARNERRMRARCEIDAFYDRRAGRKWNAAQQRDKHGSLRLGDPRGDGFNET